MEALQRQVHRPKENNVIHINAADAIRCWRRQLDPPDLEKFVLWNDQHLYDREIGRASLTDRAQVRLFNSLSSLEELHKALDILDLPNEQRLRPGWDQYFMQLASLAAQRSNCMKRRVGCVLVREGRVISTGYNGTPRNTINCNEGGCTNCQALYFVLQRYMLNS